MFNVSKAYVCYVLFSITFFPVRNMQRSYTEFLKDRDFAFTDARSHSNHFSTLFSDQGW